jgi:hypothetical protein
VRSFHVILSDYINAVLVLFAARPSTAGQGAVYIRVMAG